METYRLITPAEGELLPVEITLLAAPVVVEEPSAPGKVVGQAGGVLLDEHGDPVAFLVQMSPSLVGSALSRTFVPASAIRVEAPSTLRIAWSEDQLLAQPRLGDDLRLHNRVDGGPPQMSRWMPARPNIVPPGRSGSVADALKGAFVGAIICAVIGVIPGFLFAGWIGAAALALLFAAGGAVAGLLRGAARDSAADASEFDEELSGRASASARKQPALMSLARALRDPALTERLSSTDLEIVRQDASIDFRAAHTN